MQPYEFKPGSAVLTEQPDGQWMAEFAAAIYAHQTFDEISNSVNAQNIRIIEFDVLGDENQPLDYYPGNSTPYTRGTEEEVKLILIRDGQRNGTVSTSY